MVRVAMLVIAATLGIAVLAWKLCYVRPPTAIASLPQRWEDQVYSLDEDETVRFVAPPFPPGRKQRVSWAEKQVGLAVYGSQVYTISRSSNPRGNVIREGYPY